jgi:hypothetical protein
MKAKLSSWIKIACGRVIGLLKNLHQGFVHNLGLILSPAQK